VLLNILLEARSRVNVRATKALADMFVASDVNGDGILSLEEFTALIKHVRSDVSLDMVGQVQVVRWTPV
jgi:Ca2+-binding EF-hand superfamily protein